MNLTTIVKDNVNIFSASGRLDTNTSTEYEKLIEKQMGDQKKHIIVDLKKLEYISSSGLRIFLKLAKKQKDAGKEFILCSLSKEIFEIFDMTGFSSIITIYHSQEEALQQISPK